eukprot:gene9078-18808_t
MDDNSSHQHVIGESDSGKKKKKETVAEKTVSMIRLRQIEREHRSIGSILDKRHLHDLDEVNIHPRATIDTNKDDHKNKIKISPGDHYIEKSALKPEEFEEEEMIWRSKSRAPGYVVKRRFEDPGLEVFRNTMNPIQKKKYHAKSRDALFELSQNLRDDLQEVKNEMDERGIFHPEANAHRVHCLYLLKLYRSINAETIEDPILRRIKDDEKGIIKESIKEEIIWKADSGKLNKNREVLRRQSLRGVGGGGFISRTASVKNLSTTTTTTTTDPSNNSLNDKVTAARANANANATTKLAIENLDT